MRGIPINYENVLPKTNRLGRSLLGNLITLLIIFAVSYLFASAIIGSIAADWLLKKKLSGNSDQSREIMGVTIGILTCVIFYYAVLKNL